MRILITQVSSFKKDAESVRCESTYILDRATTTMTVELCKQIAETKGIHIVTYVDEADMLFRLGQIINKTDTFVVGSIYGKLPKSVLAEYKVEQIGKKPAAKKVAKPAEPKEPAKKDVKAVEKKEPAKKVVKAVEKKEPAKKPVVATEAPAAAPKKPRKKKGEDVSAYIDQVTRYITEVQGDDLVYVIQLVREAVRSCGDDRMAKGFCKTKLKKEFGEDLGMQIYETIDAKYIWIKTAVGM